MQRAVGFNRNKAALCTEALSLRGYYFKVPGVYFGYYHRHVGRETVRAVIGNNGALMLCIFFFKRLYFVLFHINGAENEIYPFGYFINIALGIKNGHIPQILGNRLFHSPAAAYCVGIFFIG